jgi:hypothetical protein
MPVTVGRNPWPWVVGYGATVIRGLKPIVGEPTIPWVETHGSCRPPIVPFASATAEPHRGCPDSWCIRTMAPAFPCGREIVSFRRYSSVATRRGAGGVALRGLKPTAKFIRRYATMHKVQTYNGFQPTVACPHTHPCGRDARAPRPFPPEAKRLAPHPAFAYRRRWSSSVLCRTCWAPVFGPMPFEREAAAFTLGQDAMGVVR